MNVLDNLQLRGKAHELKGDGSTLIADVVTASSIG